MKAWESGIWRRDYFVEQKIRNQSHAAVLPDGLFSSKQHIIYFIH